MTFLDMLLFMKNHIFLELHHTTTLRSQIENVVVRAITKYNERNKIYNSCSLQSKQIITI